MNSIKLVHLFSTNIVSVPRENKITHRSNKFVETLTKIEHNARSLSRKSPELCLGSCRNAGTAATCICREYEIMCKFFRLTAPQFHGNTEFRTVFHSVLCAEKLKVTLEVGGRTGNGSARLLAAIRGNRA